MGWWRSASTKLRVLIVLAVLLAGCTTLAVTNADFRQGVQDGIQRTK